MPGFKNWENSMIHDPARLGRVLLVLALLGAFDVIRWVMFAPASPQPVQ